MNLSKIFKQGRIPRVSVHGLPVLFPLRPSSVLGTQVGIDLSHWPVPRHVSKDGPISWWLEYDKHVTLTSVPLVRW